MISAIDGSSAKSILLSSYLVVDQRIVRCVSLVDSGCSALAFIDFQFAVRHRLPLSRLPRKRPLFLADGILSSWIEWFVQLPYGIGDHQEHLFFFVTTLSAENPIILGLPWLQRHNPEIDWDSLRLRFTDRCQGRCLPPHLPGQIAPAGEASPTEATAAAMTNPVDNQVARCPEEKNQQLPTRVANQFKTLTDQPSLLSKTQQRKARRACQAAREADQKRATVGKPFQATVEDVEDEGDPYPRWSYQQRQKRAAARKRWREEQRFQRQRERAIDEGPRWTMAPPGARARMIEASAPQPRKVPARTEVTAGARHASRPARLQKPLFRPQRRRERLDPNDIKLLAAQNFVFACRQKGVVVMKVTMEELEEAVKNDPGIYLPDLPDNFFKDLLCRRGSVDTYKAALPSNLHDFIDDLWSEGEVFRRVTEDDVKKFFDKANRPDLTVEEIKKRLPPEYRDLYEAFLPKEANTLPPHRSYDHKIEVIPGSKLPYSRNRPLSPMELRVLKRWLDDQLANGFIRPSKSSVSSPILLAQKPGGGIRICVDYRGVNNITMKSRYPIPLIRETLDAICKAKIFTKLDVIAAFNRVRIAEGHEWLTAFITRFGLYESLVTPFGLQGAPATFQNYINDILYDLLDDCATAYLDDILIYSVDRADHVQQVREVLKRLIDAGLQVDLNKCDFHTTRTKYLGLIITPGGIEMDPEKVAAITAWEPPTTKKQLQRFLGFANFYRRFIRDFSGVAKPLYDLTKKTAEWQWSDAHQKAFERLRQTFTTAPALRIYDWDRPAVVEVDASNWSAGGVLLQPDNDGELHPVAYFSSKHSAQECNYDIYDKELLAVIKALEEWRPELEGAAHRFDIVTDHKNLQTFATTKQLSPRHMRWSEFLSQFNFRIVYRPGAANARPDALSRKPEHLPDDGDDRLRNRKRPLIDPAKFDPFSFELGEELRLFQLDVSQPIDNLIATSYRTSPFLADVLAALTDPGHRAWPKEIKKRLRIPFAECRVVAGKVYFRDRLMIDPDDYDLQLQLIYRTHASGPGGHPGRTKTLDLMNRKYWWPGMSQAVRGYCRACLPCNKTKTPRSAPAGFLKPLPIPLAPWRDISVDYITPLPPCTRRGSTYKHIAVVVDRLTKMRHFIATETLEAEELADRFIERVYTLHGLPETIVSDRGSQFVSAFWRALSARLAVTLRPSSAFHPQTNGQTERINAELEQYLRLFVDWAQDDWADWLPLAEFAGNNTVSETTGVSPFFANYGFHPRMGVEPAQPCPPTLTDAQRREFFKASEIANRFQAILEKVTALAKQAQDRYEEGANRRRSDAPAYKVGDQVMVNTKNFKTGRPSQKLEPRWEGPFPVTKASSHAVTLKLPANMRVFNTFHVSLVRPYRNKEGIPGQEQTAGDVRANRGRMITRTDDEEEVRWEWEFEDILDYGKADNGRWQYLIKWVGYDEPTWQPATDLRGCDDAIWAFHDAHPELPGPPSWVPRRRSRVARENDGKDDGDDPPAPPTAASRKTSQEGQEDAAPRRRSARLAARAVRTGKLRQHLPLRSILRKPQQSRFWA